MLVDPADDGSRFPFSRLGGPKETVRVHLDFYTAEQARHVRRLVRLGAIRLDEWPYPDGAGFMGLDPVVLTVIARTTIDAD